MGGPEHGDRRVGVDRHGPAHDSGDERGQRLGRREHPGVEHERVEAAEAADRRLHRRGHRGLVRDVAADADVGGPVGHLVDPSSRSRPTTAAPAASNARARGQADARGRARHHRHVTRQRGRRRAPGQLRLLELPVLDVEQVGLADCRVAAQLDGPLDDPDRVAVDVRGESGVGGLTTDGQHAQLGIDHDAGRRVDGHERTVAQPGPVAGDVGLVVPHVAGDIPPDQRDALGAQDVVGRRRAHLGHRREVVACGEASGRLAGVAAHDHRLRRGGRDVPSQHGHGAQVAVEDDRGRPEPCGAGDGVAAGRGSVGPAARANPRGPRAGRRRPVAGAERRRRSSPGRRRPPLSGPARCRPPRSLGSGVGPDPAAVRRRRPSPAGRRPARVRRPPADPAPPVRRAGDQVDVVLVGGAGVVGEGEQPVVEQHHPDRPLVAPGGEQLGAQRRASAKPGMT